MCKTLFIAFAALLSSTAGRAEQAPTTASGSDGLACFENLPTPEYPKAALQAHVDGSIWTWTQVSPEGVPGKIDTQVVSAWSEAPKLLIAPAEKAIHAAKIKSACAGKTVWVVFRYQLNGTATANPKVTSRQDGPNILWVESQPELVTAAANRPAANKAAVKH